MPPVPCLLLSVIQMSDPASGHENDSEAGVLFPPSRVDGPNWKRFPAPLVICPHGDRCDETDIDWAPQPTTSIF